MPCTTVMIVDDDEMLLEALPATLQLKFPHLTVESFDSVQMALARLKAQRFSVILTDLVMPRGDGFEILGEAQRHQPQTPVIAMTGRCDGQTAQAAFSRGAFDLLWKPLDRDDLIHVLRCALSTYRLRDLIDRQTMRIRRLTQLIERTQRSAASSGPRFAAVLMRTQMIEEQSLRRLMSNVEALTKHLEVRQKYLGMLRERLASRLDKAHARATGRLVETADDYYRFG
jgi:FixJ family two-component response regulator